MRNSLENHPTVDQLRAFAQGRLQPEAMRTVEAHVSACDSCCEHLATVPDDTLMHLAREAATHGVRSADTDPRPGSKTDPRAIPAELADHPRYHVLGLIGVGGMGAVYKAEHRLMERLVALKVISPKLLSNSKAVERFRREFRTVAKLSHPNVVAAHDADQAGDLHFLVMEFVEGLSLDRLVAQTGQLSAPQACNLIRQAALGLQHMFEKGLVHRDIKPQNLMVARKGQLKILDCGLVRIASHEADEPTTCEAGPERPDATAEGMILGTPDYIAPEQIADARSADIRADIYSLGCTLYFLLTGQPPFPRGTTMDKLASHAREAPTPIQTLRSDLPAELVRILDRMLAKNPADRFQTPAELAKALAPLAKGQATELASGRRGAAESAVTAITPPPVDVVTPPPVVCSPAVAVASTLPAETPPMIRTEYPVLSTQYSGSNMASPKRPGSRSVAARTRLNPRSLLALAIGGLALVGLLAAIPLASSLFSKPNQSAKVPSGDAGPTTASSSVTSESSTSTATPVATSLPKEVLFIIPNRGLWYADYGPVKDKLKKAGFTVKTASTSLQECELDSNSQWGQARADIVLNGSVKAADYGAIVFGGLDTRDFHPGTQAGKEVSRLLQECESNGHFVTAICAGQRVLAAHNFLKGKRASFPSAISGDSLILNCGADWQPSPVTTDGKLITAARDSNSDQFAKAIFDALSSR